MLEDMYCRKHSGCPNVSDSLSRCRTGEQQVLRGALAPNEQHVLWGALAPNEQQVLRGAQALKELILIKDEYM